MVEVRKLPPTAPQWALILTDEERDTLLTALDLARTYLISPLMSTDKKHELSPAFYQKMIDPIEQALAATLVMSHG